MKLLKRHLHGATWGRIMWGLTHELRTLWPQSVYMEGVPACITDKSLTSCWPEIKMYWRQRPLFCINMYTLCWHYSVKFKKARKIGSKMRKNFVNKAGPYSFSVELPCICRIAAACVPACALAFARKLHQKQAIFGLPSGPVFRPKLLAWMFWYSMMYYSSIAISFKLVPLGLNNTIWVEPFIWLLSGALFKLKQLALLSCFTVLSLQ